MATRRARSHARDSAGNTRRNERARDIFFTMNPTQIQQFRDRLIEQREQIVAGWTDGETEQDELLRDPEELATRITRSEVEDRVQEDERNLVEKIDFALRRIETGTYGLCTGCGASIPLARLEAKPSVSLCIACQEKKDAEAE